PWVDGSDGAAVRIAMTVATREVATGILQTVVMEDAMEHGEFSIQLATQRGQIQSNLRVGANINSARPLIANRGICFQGVKLVGSGFRLDEATYMAQDKEDRPVLREYWTGRDVTARRVPEWVIDFFGMEEDEARKQHPRLYQKLVHDVKPFRDQVARASHRERWWVFGEPRPGLR